MSQTRLVVRTTSPFCCVIDQPKVGFVYESGGLETVAGLLPLQITAREAV